ncbi:hypothetical protein [Dietzia sp.]|uniref:hypothetical protein n=1 Tax=Dietzia sp. TaxID=1871616 RepID=UPI002FD8F193
MTPDSAPAVDVDAVAAPRVSAPGRMPWREPGPLWGLFWRWAAIAVIVGAGFWRTEVHLVDEVNAGAESTHVFLVLACAVFLALATARKRLPELPIFDRQTDIIVGIVLAAIAAMLRFFVVPRYPAFFALLHPDIPAAYVLAMAACVFLFGLRRTAHYWSSWAVLLLASPGVVRLAGYIAGGGDFGFAVVLVPLAAICAGAGVGTSLKKGVALAGVSAAVGFSVLGLWAGLLGQEVGPLTQALPVLAALACAVPALVRLPAASGRARPRQAVSAREGLKCLPLIVAIAVIVAVADLPQSAQGRAAMGPPGPTGRTLAVPDLWKEISQSDLPWAPSMFGPGATIHEQLLRSTTPRRDWDEKERPRMVAAYTISAHKPGIFDVYPVEMTFDTRRSRTSAAEPIALPHGVTARFRTVVDDTTYLTWSILSFLWSRSDGTTQRIMLLSIDNHDFDAVFPRPMPGTLSTAERLASILLRGNSSVSDEFSERKDVDMLTELGGDIVEAQWTR